MQARTLSAISVVDFFALAKRSYKNRNPRVVLFILKRSLSVSVADDLYIGWTAVIEVPGINGIMVIRLQFDNLSGPVLVQYSNI